VKSKENDTLTKQNRTMRHREDITGQTHPENKQINDNISSPRVQFYINNYNR